MNRNKEIRYIKKNKIKNLIKEKIIENFDSLIESYYLNFEAIAEFENMLSLAFEELSIKYALSSIKSLDISEQMSKKELNNKNCDKFRNFDSILIDEEELSFDEYFEEKLNIFL